MPLSGRLKETGWESGALKKTAAMADAYHEAYIRKEAVIHALESGTRRESRVENRAADLNASDATGSAAFCSNGSKMWKMAGKEKGENRQGGKGYLKRQLLFGLSENLTKI